MKKRKRKSNLIYALSLTAWILVLAIAAFFVLKTVWKVAEYWEAAEVNPVLDEYIETLKVDMWENEVRETISGVPHEFQTDEECVQVLRDILKDEIRYSVTPGKNDGATRTYDLQCGGNKFGQVVLVQDKQMPDENAIIRACIEKFYLYPWHVQSVEFFFDGLYTSMEITVPASYQVLVNGHELGEEYIVERDIHFSSLEELYSIYEGVPTKVTYRVDNIFGHVDYQILDENGQEFQIDPEKDDSQFIELVTGERYDRLYTFTREFASRYLEFSAGTDDMDYLYNRVMPYVQKGSELEDRLLRAMDSYVGWQHNKNFRFYDATLNDVTPLGSGFYVLDVSASASAEQPIGFVRVDRNMRILVKYDLEKDEAVAFSVVDY